MVDTKVVQFPRPLLELKSIDKKVYSEELYPKFTLSNKNVGKLLIKIEHINGSEYYLEQAKDNNALFSKMASDRLFYFETHKAALSFADKYMAVLGENGACLLSFSKIIEHNQVFMLVDAIELEPIVLTPSSLFDAVKFQALAKPTQSILVAS